MRAPRDLQTIKRSRRGSSDSEKMRTVMSIPRRPIIKPFSRVDGYIMVRSWMWVAWTLKKTMLLSKSHPTSWAVFQSAGGICTSTAREAEQDWSDERVRTMCETHCSQTCKARRASLL